jgi:hypothetical protein
MFFRYMAARDKAASLPSVEVTREEFVKMMTESGQTQEDAEFQATMASGLGSEVMIGEKMVSIKKG